MQFLGRYQRKTRSKIKAHLVSENRQGTRTRAVGFSDAFLQDTADEIMILAHFSMIDRFKRQREGMGKIFTPLFDIFYRFGSGKTTIAPKDRFGPLE